MPSSTALPAAVGLPPEQQAIRPAELYEWVRTQVPKSADAVFIGGNGFRAIGVIEALEQELDRPVLTASQVAFWRALRLSGTSTPVAVVTVGSSVSSRAK